MIARRFSVAIGLAAFAHLLFLAGPVPPAHSARVVPHPVPGAAGTGWPQYRFDAAGTAFNPFEVVLSPANVGQLTLLWRAGLGDYDAPDPIVVDGVVYAVSHFGVAYGLDAVTGDVLWRVNLGALTNGDAPAVSSGNFYTATLNGDVVAIDLATRRILWKTNVGGAIRHSMNVSDGFVYVNGDDADLEALDAATGALVWSASGVEANNTPALSNGLLYVGDNALTIWAMDATTGTPVWKKRVSCYCYLDSQVVVGEGVAAVGVDKKVEALDATTGALLWSGNVNSYARSPAVANGVLYVTSSSDHGQYGPTRAFDLVTGAQLWETDLPGATSLELSTANGVVYMGADDRHVYALDAATGTRLWQSPLMRSYAFGSPIVADGILYASDSSGVLYAFGLP